MKIRFLRGWQSTPTGVKPACLKNRVHEAVNPDWPDADIARWVAREACAPRQPLPPRTHEAGVPRRFGVGTLLLITTLYALLFALLRAFHASPVTFFLIALFFTAIGLGQMLLFHGQRPRRASILVGAFFPAALAIPVWLARIALGTPYARFSMSRLLDGLFWETLAGAICGYLAGMLIAAVFLLFDKIVPKRK
jgi:hypothetical protein